MNKYVDLPKNDLNDKVQNAWFHTCCAKRTPFITIKSRTKLADVHWDYITYPPHADEVLSNLNGQLRDEAIAIFMKYANSRSEYSINDQLVWFKNIEIPKAKLAAEELYDLIVNYVEAG